MGNVDDGHALAFQVGDQLKESFDLFVGQHGSRFVKNQYRCISGQCLADLHDLLIGDAELPDPGIDIDVAESDIIQEFPGPVIHAFPVNNSAILSEFINEYIFRHGQMLKQREFLINNRNPVLYSVVGFSNLYFLTPQFDFTVVRLEGTGQNPDERRFPGTIFAD